MAADGAIANSDAKNTTLAGRSAVFAGMAATVNAKGKAVSRELNQQVWESETQIANDTHKGQVYYLHELVADHRSASTPSGSGIVQSGDPRVYGSCSVASNDCGVAFRGWFYREDYATNAYFQYLLQAGFIMIYAFRRYTPTAEKLPDGTWHVTLRNDRAPHKVVITGYRTEGAFPMVLNDPGSGQHADVTFSRTLTGRGYGDPAATGSAISKVTFFDDKGQPQDRGVNTHMLYSTDLNASAAVNFIEHLDGISLDWTPFERTFHGQWASGWTHLLTFEVAGAPRLLSYNRTTHAAQIAGFFSNGNGIQSLWQGTWGAWSHHAVVVIDHVPRLLSYSAATGQAMFSAFSDHDQGVFTIWSGTWGPWTHLVPVAGRAENVLVTYDGATGQLMTSRYGAGLHGTATAWSGTVEKGWTHVKASSLDGQDALLFFNAGTGASAFRLMDTALAWGAAQPLFDPMPGRATFEPLPFTGPVNLTAWNPAAATLELYRRWGGNTLASDDYPYAFVGRQAPFPQAGAPAASKDALCASFRMDGNDLQMVYLPATGEVAFYRLRPF